MLGNKYRKGAGRRPVWVAIITAVASLAMLVTSATASSGITGSAKPRGSSSSPVQIDALVPLTGPSAFISTKADLPGFKLAVSAINKAGGILGRKVNLIETDSGIDPSDSVAAVRQLLATHPDLAGVVGMTSDTAAVDGYLLNSAHMVTITQAGTTQLDKVHWPYVFRDWPEDAAQGAAMAAYALGKNWKRAALLFIQSAGYESLGSVVAQEYASHGGTVVANEALPSDASSYQAVLESALAGHPQVIFYDVDPQTASTLFSEMNVMNHLDIPIVGVATAAEATFLQALEGALGSWAAVSRSFAAVTPPALTSNRSYQIFLSYYHKSSFTNRILDTYIPGNYDSVVIEALAMDMAHSTDPKIYVKDVPKVVGNQHAMPVYSYAQGLAAIRSGKPFYYVSTQGPMTFNKFNSIGGDFVVEKLNRDGTGVLVVGAISNKTVSTYLGK